MAMSAWQLQVRRVRKEMGLVFGERLRLSREIHDTLLQSLVGIALGLDSASHNVDAPPSRRREQLTGLRKQVEEYIREVRQSIWDLRSPALDRHGLVGALRSTGERLTAGKARFAFTVSGTPRSCPSKVETHALRIGHEAVMNAVRHSTAQHVKMEVGFDDRVLRLCVTDDGGGFTSQVAEDPEQHYGLATMRERALDAGGCCTVESIPGTGVQVIAEFPLAPLSQA
jgi:signal transduction histidine kinase